MRQAMNEGGLPRYSGPLDHLRYGFESLQAETATRHPVDILQREVVQTD
jgi:hypothetical protein